jgi:hypothetical protein
VRESPERTKRPEEFSTFSKTGPDWGREGREVQAGKGKTNIERITDRALLRVNSVDSEMKCPRLKNVVPSPNYLAPTFVQLKWDAVHRIFGISRKTFSYYYYLKADLAFRGKPKAL